MHGRAHDRVKRHVDDQVPPWTRLSKNSSVRCLPLCCLRARLLMSTMNSMAARCSVPLACWWPWDHLRQIVRCMKFTYFKYSAYFQDLDGRAWDDNRAWPRPYLSTEVRTHNRRACASLPPKFPPNGARQKRNALRYTCSGQPIFNILQPSSCPIPFLLSPRTDFGHAHHKEEASYTTTSHGFYEIQS